MLSLLGDLENFETIINAVKRTGLLNETEKFESKITGDDSKENMETRTHEARRS